MELYFLLLLFLLMMAAGPWLSCSLCSTRLCNPIDCLAAAAGLVFFGDAKVFFHQDGPIEWLSAGIMNFRAIYYDLNETH